MDLKTKSINHKINVLFCYTSCMKKIVFVLLLLLTGCSSTTSSLTKADMSHYENFNDEDHVFYEMNVKEMVDKIDNNETFVVYFGFSECPWCNVAMPILNETAKEYDSIVYYIDTRSNEEWESNMDIDDYDLVVDYLGEYLDYDDDGKKHLYTPHVFFFKEGEVVKEHEGTIDGKTDEITTQEKEQLKQIYEEGFEAIK